MHVFLGMCGIGGIVTFVLKNPCYQSLRVLFCACGNEEMI